MEAQLRIYPNPATEDVLVSTDGIVEIGDNIRVLDPLGKIVMEEYLPANATTHRLDVRPLPAGNYIVQYVGANTFGTSRLVIEK